MAGAIQSGLYFGTYALPHYVRYPSASLLGPWPQIFPLMLGVYLVGVVLLALRKIIIGRWVPGIWTAVLTGLAGAWFLSAFLRWLPADVRS